jgi:methylmalonyl-CoA mutase N-terminal domain/subunit
LTDEVEKAAWQLIEKIDAMGGSVPAIEQGFMQEEIARSAYEHQRLIETGEKIIVGVNKFQTEENTNIPLLRIDESIQKIQSDKLKQLRAKRDASKVSAALTKLHSYASGNENLMPAVVEAVENYCTLGEIADELRTVFGEYR